MTGLASIIAQSPDLTIGELLKFLPALSGGAVLAVVFYLTFVSRKIVSRDELDRAEKRAERAEQRADQLQDLALNAMRNTKELAHTANRAAEMADKAVEGVTQNYRGAP